MRACLLVRMGSDSLDSRKDLHRLPSTIITLHWSGTAARLPSCSSCAAACPSSLLKLVPVCDSWG